MRIILFFFLSITLVSCGNQDYYPSIAIPAKQHRNGDYGLVRLDGSKVVDFELDEKPSLMVSDRAHFKENGQLKFVDQQGNQTPTDFLNALHFNEGHALVQIQDGRLAFINKESYNTILVMDEVLEAGYINEGIFKFRNQNNQWGFMNLQGDVVIPPRYDQVSVFNEGYAVVYQKGEDQKLIGVINKKGEEVIKPTDKYESIGSFSNGLASFKEEEEQGYLNPQGEEVIKSTEWKEVFPFKDGHTTVQGLDKEFGYIDSKGQMLINTREKYPIRFYNDLAVYVDVANRKGGFMNERRELTSRAEFDELLPFLSDGAWGKDGGSWYYVDKYGKDMQKAGVPAIKLLYHEAFSENLLLFNRPFDIEQTLESEYIDLEGFIGSLMDLDSPWIFVSNNMAASGVNELQNLLDNYLKDDQTISALENVNGYQTRIDTQSFKDSDLIYDHNLHFALRLDYSKNVFNQTEDNYEVSNESLLKKLRFTVHLKNKAQGRGDEVMEYFSTYLLENGYKKKDNQWEFIGSKGTNVQLTRKYNRIYFTISPTD